LNEVGVVGRSRYLVRKGFELDVLSRSGVTQRKSFI
jgi:hypothetical protein